MKSSVFPLEKDLEKFIGIAFFLGWLLQFLGLPLFVGLAIGVSYLFVSSSERRLSLPAFRRFPLSGLAIAVFGPFTLVVISIFVSMKIGKADWVPPSREWIGSFFSNFFAQYGIFSFFFAFLAELGLATFLQRRFRDRFDPWRAIFFVSVTNVLLGAPITIFRASQGVAGIWFLVAPLLQLLTLFSVAVLAATLFELKRSIWAQIIFNSMIKLTWFFYSAYLGGSGLGSLVLQSVFIATGLLTLTVGKTRFKR